MPSDEGEGDAPPALPKPLPVRRIPGYHVSLEIIATNSRVDVPTQDGAENDICAVCRQIVTDDLFSICCDKCDMWVHGECIHMEAAEGGTVKKYYCPPCQASTGLTVQYKGEKKKKRRRKDGEGEMGSPSPNKHRSPSNLEKAPEPLKVYDERACAMDTCSVLHRRWSKYCSPECGLAQAAVHYKQGMEVEPKAQAEAGIVAAAGVPLAARVTGMTQADEADLHTFKELQLQIRGKHKAMTELDGKRLR
jgi:hypothetical protein